jgi:hypothetical protein
MNDTLYEDFSSPTGPVLLKEFNFHLDLALCSLCSFPSTCVLAELLYRPLHLHVGSPAQQVC